MKMVILDEQSGQSRSVGQLFGLQMCP